MSLETDPLFLILADATDGLSVAGANFGEVTSSIVFSGGPDPNRIAVGQYGTPFTMPTYASRPTSLNSQQTGNQTGTQNGKDSSNSNMTMHRIPFSMFPEYARSKLSAFDTDGDESLDVDEILAGCDALAREKQRSKNLVWIIAGLICLILLLLTAIGVMMFVIVQAAKDTGMAGSTLTVKGSNNTVQTANSDFYVADGMMKNRNDASNRRCTSRRQSDGSCGAESALMTSQAAFPAPLNSQMDDDDLRELKQLTINQDTSWIHFMVRMYIAQIMHRVKERERQREIKRERERARARARERRRRRRVYSKLMQ